MKYPHLSLQFQPSYFWLNVKNIAGHRTKTADLNPLPNITKMWRIPLLFLFIIILSAFCFKSPWCWWGGAKHVIFYNYCFDEHLIFLRVFVGTAINMPPFSSSSALIVLPSSARACQTSMGALLPCQFRNLPCEVLALERLGYYSLEVLSNMSPYNNWCFHPCRLLSFLVTLLKIFLSFWIEKEKPVKEYEQLSLSEGFLQFRSLQLPDFDGSSVLLYSSRLILSIILCQAALPLLLLCHLQYNYIKPSQHSGLIRSYGFSVLRILLLFIQ